MHNALRFEVARFLELIFAKIEDKECVKLRLWNSASTDFQARCIKPLYSFSERK